MSLAIAVLLSTGLAVPAAQRVTEQETGSNIPVPRRARIPDDGKLSDHTRGRIVMGEFARCVVDRKAATLDRALAQFDGKDYGRAVMSLMTNDCLSNGQMRFKTTMVRGPLFTELYRRKADAVGRGRNWGPTVAPFDLGVTPTGAEHQQQIGLMSFADCVVAQDRAGAEAVVLAPTAGKAQDAAIRALAPTFGGCLPQGQEISLPKQSIEGAIAEVLYRGVKKPATASGVDQGGAR